MSVLSQIYQQKISSVLRLIGNLELDRETLLQKYKNESFPDTELSKYELFSEVLESSEIAEKHSAYMEEKCGKLSHFRDRRTGFEYAIDLILGWIAEDAVLLMLKSMGENVVLGGEDRYREFLSAMKISTGPDLTITKSGGKVRRIELMCDWKETWKRQKHIDLRDNKYGKLVREKSLFLGLAPISEEGFALDFGLSLDGWNEEYNPAYRKSCYTNRAVAEWLKPADEAINDLLAMV